jgi:broad specificity phosphatase PhoE
MIYFMRHGQTDFNKENKWMGLLDIPLNENGISQALSSINYIKSLNIDIIYCSELKRAIQTSKIIANELNLPILIDRRLNERSLGSLEGRIKNLDLLENCSSIEAEYNISKKNEIVFKD